MERAKRAQPVDTKALLVGGTCARGGIWALDAVGLPPKKGINAHDKWRKKEREDGERPFD